MGLFDLFKGKGAPSVELEGMLDDYTWLEEMKHSVNGSWHMYDVSFFAGGYDWNYIKDSAEYMIQNDLTKVVEVKIADTADHNITEEFLQTGSLLTTPSMDTERRVISVAGFSKVLDKNMMIIWIANARVMKFITDFDDETLIKKYAETLLRKNFGTENEMKMGKPVPV